MAEKALNIPTDFNIETLMTLMKSVFSMVVLTAIGVIISGKLMTKRIPIYLSSDDHFTINLIILKLRSSGDEVAWGFIMFIAAIFIVVVFGGLDAYIFLKNNSGVDIGHWNSLCAIASCFSILTSTFIWIISPIFRGTPLLNSVERNNQLKLLSKNLLNENDGEGGEGGEI